jgi:hypothetical protein
MYIMGPYEYNHTDEWEQRASQLCLDYALNGYTMTGESCLTDIIQSTSGLLEKTRSNLYASIATLEEAVKGNDLEKYNHYRIICYSLIEELDIHQSDLYSYQEMQCALLWDKAREAKLYAESFVKREIDEINDLEMMELGMANIMIRD